MEIHILRLPLYEPVRVGQSGQAEMAQSFSMKSPIFLQKPPCPYRFRCR